MDSALNKLQESINKLLLNRPTEILYNKIIIEPIANICEEIRKTKKFPTIPSKVSSTIDIYTELCTMIMIEEYTEHVDDFEYSLFKDSILSIDLQLRVILAHPFLINILLRNITFKEWDKYREELLDRKQSLYGSSSTKTNIEQICEIGSDVLNNSKFSNIHKFHYFIGIDFKEELTSLTYDEMMRNIGENAALLAVHLSKKVPSNAVAIYNRIEKLNKELILNEKKVESLRAINIPKKIYTFDNDYEIINKDAKIFYIALCYDDNGTFSKCTFTLASNVFPISFLERYIEGAIPKTIEREIIDIYLQEWFFEKFGDATESLENLNKAYDMLHKIAHENYDENIDRCINKIIADSRVDEIMINEKERGIFNTYVHGLKILPRKRIGDVVTYLQMYLGETS